MKDGRVEKADLIVTATGYYPPQELVRRLLGDEMADKIGPVWGVAEDGEMNNMYRPTAQKGLWFMGGGLAQCRIYAKPLALQIKAHEERLVD
jgi:putative flavoprotein involved in K+ transport